MDLPAAVSAVRTRLLEGDSLREVTMESRLAVMGRFATPSRQQSVVKACIRRLQLINLCWQRKIHRKKVENTSTDYEKMPDTMHPLDFFHCVKDTAHRIGNTTSYHKL